MAFARGKIILLGEHAVVYGHPAIASAIDRGVHAQATVTDGDVDRLSIAPWGQDVGPSADESAEALCRAFHVALDGRAKDRPRLLVTCDVGLPSGAGLGCSAALGVAVIDAIDEVLGTPRSREALAEAAFAWEQVFHGNPSGIDNTVAALGGIVSFRRSAQLETVRPRRPLPMVVAYSGESSSTKVTVASVARQRERRPAEIDALFEAIASIVDNGRLAIEAGDLRGLGKLFDANHMLLSSMMLSTERLERLCGAARGAGALGTKLTGGGGGGCMIALVTDREASLPVLAAIRAEGADPFYVEAGT
jgi:mevalonate kinase